ncbi:MAG: RIP metalloprotease RseP [Firmicutes bacterium]|nr:RIP metalloprotease RseP [Bacillota bacterium]MCL5038592.1 RIP metalloprotease RseP [Bacillota bacterium]
MTIAVSILVFGLLIFIHEFGHFLVAKRVGIKVQEFALGMGPKLVGYQRGETLYSLRLFPIGGFVRMAGMEAHDQEDERGFNKKSVWQRMAVIFAGPLMNLVLAAILFASIFAFIGLPVYEPVIGEVIPGHPAAEAGVLPGDKILAINGEAVGDWGRLVNLIQKRPGEPLVLEVQRGNQRLQLRLVAESKTGEDGQTRGFIGIGPVIRRQDPLEAMKNGFWQTIGIILFWFKALGLMLTKKMAVDFAGPIGITQMIGEATRTGLTNLLSLAGALSANLGLINLLPIPALDGSRLMFLLVEVVRGKRLDPARENFIHFLGFALLIFLAIFIAYQDILRLGM